MHQLLSEASFTIYHTEVDELDVEPIRKPRSPVSGTLDALLPQTQQIASSCHPWQLTDRQLVGQQQTPVPPERRELDHRQ